MKASSLNEIKKELGYLDPKSVQELCMRVAKYRKENKELLTYLLFESHDEPGYINNVKREIDELFNTLPKGIYLMKKSLRKILRITNKQIRYSESKQTEVDLRIYFCSKIKKSGIQLQTSQALSNLYRQQLKKIETALAKLPEDLQYDHHRELEQLK